MKIYKINRKKESNGLFPIPENLTNKIMFQYPYYGTTEYDKSMIKKINAIVAMFGERYNFYSIGMMGHDNMIVFTYDKMGICIPTEHQCHFGLYEIHDNILIEIEWDTDYIKRDRYLKLNKIYDRNRARK